MSVAPLGTNVCVVTELNAGADIERRRLAIGMSVAALAKAAGVDRGRLAALESGARVRDTTLAAVTRTLADMEHELGMDLPSQVQPVVEPERPPFIRFTVEGVYGAKALVVEGPVENVAELEAAVDRIMRRLQAGANDSSDQ